MSSSTSSTQQLPPVVPTALLSETQDPYGSLSFARASQAQILRAHQRDTSQIRRLIELVSESLRSLAGTRWLAHRQSMIDLAVRAAYLILTFGRGMQTLGEEYTDITPFTPGRTKMPGRTRRLLTILFLLTPSVLTTKALTTYLRRTATGSEGELSKSSRLRHRLAHLLESPFGQSLPEMHMVAFLMRGRFFEFGRRLTGTTYISTQAPKPPDQRGASYEPLAILLALPILFRLFPRRQAASPMESQVDTPAMNGHAHPTLPLSPPLTPPLSAEQTLLLSKPADYDLPNTYLDASALVLPERQCTLCLEPRGTGEGSGGTVGVTECGHIFCWGCLGGLEKPECPLCRQSIRMERLIAAYNL